MNQASDRLYKKFIASSRIKNLSQMEHLYLVILAGGEGTRLFPYSNPERPKQLCHIDGGDRRKDTFLKRTIANFVDAGFSRDRIIVVTSSERQVAITRHQACSPGGITLKNVWNISAIHGYYGTMVETTKRISEFDPGAIIVNIPSDHFLVPDYQFVEVIMEAVNNASQGYVSTVESESHDTGIIVWKAKELLKKAPSDTENLDLKQLMDSFGDDYKTSIGSFVWHDCDTFRGLYRAIEKTHLHHNVILGEGDHVLDSSCHHSLLYVDKGMILNVSDAVELAVVFTMIKHQPVLLVSKLNESQKIKDLAEDFAKNGKLTVDETELEANNNQILYSNISDQVSFAFVGVKNCAVRVYRRSDYGNYEAEIFKKP